MMNENSKNAGKMLRNNPINRNDQDSEKNSLDSLHNRQFEIHLKKRKRECASTVVQVPLANLLDFAQIYEWRSQTDYPIVACSWKQVIFNKSKTLIANKAYLQSEIERHPLDQSALITVQAEQVLPLDQYEPLSVANFMYAIKESLVGFERLLALFGSFEIMPRMITVNVYGRVKVWISPHYDQNTKIGIDQLKLYTNEEQHIIHNIKEVFLKFATENSTFRDFFKGLEGIYTFLHFIKYLEEFSAAKKIIASKRLLKKVNSANKRPLSPIINLRPIVRTPKFIAVMQSQKESIGQNKDIPSLVLAFRKSQQKSKEFHFSELKTKETVGVEADYKQDFLGEPNSTLMGKILKNHINSQLAKVKSLNNLYPKPPIEAEVQQSSFEQSFNRLFEDEQVSTRHQTKKAKLMQLGRRIRTSIITK